MHYKSEWLNAVFFLNISSLISNEMVYKFNIMFYGYLEIICNIVKSKKSIVDD